MSNFKGKIDIVLATYNGEKYLPEQINSILKMDGFEELVNTIIVCDDNSSDTTLDIVNELIPNNKLMVIKNEQGKSYGPAKNFERGIALSKSEYVMLSDQDDIWLRNKLLRYLEEASKCNANKPFIIFSDLEVVNAKLQTIDPSFFHYQSINKVWIKELNNILVQNIAPGCTMMFNQKLASITLPFPNECLMHDWWLMLLCKQYGEVRMIDNEIFIKYRQHNNNQVGAKKNSLLLTMANFQKSLAKAKVNYARTIKQMHDFEIRCGNDLPELNKRFIKALELYSNPNSLRFERVYSALKVKLKKSSLLKTIGTYVIIFIGVKK